MADNPFMVVGIGDIHGHYPALEVLLSSLQNKYNIFSNPDQLVLREGVALVQLGDKIDRGNQNLKVVETCMKLGERNPDSFFDLFGNHEFMALAALSDAKEYLKMSDRVIESGYEETTLHGINGGMTFVREFGNNGIRSCFENYVQRMSRGGDIGMWMRRLRPYAALGVGQKSILFVHGGVPDAISNAMSLQEFQKEFHYHIDCPTEKFEHSEQKYVQHPFVNDQSIFWDRQIPRKGDAHAQELVKRLGVDYITIGHTPGRDIEIYAGRVFNIDVGMCPAYGAQDPAAIVFKPEGVFAFYARKGERQLVTHNN